MACNIIMNESSQIRTTQFNATVHYDIGEINFYVPTKISARSQIFLILKNKNNLYEIVELLFSNTQGANNIYKIPLNQTLRINNETVEVRLMVLNTATGQYTISSKIDMILVTDHYNLARQVYIAQQVGSQIQNLYAKILALTEENQKIYAKIRKEKERDESSL